MTQYIFKSKHYIVEMLEEKSKNNNAKNKMNRAG